MTVGKAIDRIRKILDQFSPADQRTIYQASRVEAMTSTERSQRHRCLNSNASVAPERNESVAEKRNAAVASPPTPPVVALDLASVSPEEAVSKKKLVLEATAVLEFLNRKAGRTFRPKPATLKPIIARLKDGVSVEDCMVVIGRKVAEWSSTSQAIYLRPKTLFADENFQNYLGQQRPS